jgi:hypothetical protein
VITLPNSFKARTAARGEPHPFEPMMTEEAHHGREIV